MKNTKKVQVVMLTTKEPSKLYFNNSTQQLRYDDKYNNSPNANIYKQLYFLSDEKVKEGEYGIGYANGYRGIGSGHYFFKNDGGSFGELNALSLGSKKIVATTDILEYSDNNGVSTKDLAKIPESFIETYIASKVKITEVDLEINRTTSNFNDFLVNFSLNDKNEVIITSSENKSYSKDEVEELLYKYMVEISNHIYTKKMMLSEFDDTQWLEDNLK